MKKTVTSLCVAIAIFAGGMIAPLFTQAQAVPVQCIGEGLTRYMNAVIDGTTGLDKINLLSPVFNITNPNEVAIFDVMQSSGANFSALWGFAGNTYSNVPGAPGKRAMEWYDENFAGRFGSSNVVFTEYGDFNLDGTSPDDGSLEREVMISGMVGDFNEAAGRGNIQGIAYFNAYNGNPEFDHHALSVGELQRITSSNPSKAGANSAVYFDGPDFSQTVEGDGLTWAVEIANGLSNLQHIAASVNSTNANVVVRLCVMQSCEFEDPDTLVTFLRDLNNAVNRDVWVIAGSNEPATERWATPECQDEEEELPFDPTALPYIPCDEVRNDLPPDDVFYEYHSLRPYPTSPCNTTPSLTVSMCADDLVQRAVYSFTPGEGICTTLDNGALSCEYNVASSFDITLGLADAELPIVGNTEDVPNRISPSDNIEFIERMNEYVSWYLNGTTFRAEEPWEDIRSHTPADYIGSAVYRVINLSGPLKKLLPWDRKNDVDDDFGLRQNERDRSGDERHNQIAVCTNGPLSNSPAECYFNPDSRVIRRIEDIGPNETNDGRNVRLFSFIPSSSTEDRVGVARANLRGYSIGGTQEGGSGVTSMVFTDSAGERELYFAHMEETDELGSHLQDTYVPYGYDKAPDAPTPGLDEQMNSDFCEPIEEPVSNPGDKLYGDLVRNGGQPTQGTMEIEANFVCIFPPPVPDPICMADCIGRNPDALPTPDEYCLATECPVQEITTCEREVMIPMIVEISTPLADNLWSRFVMGGMSVFRRFFPHINENSPVDEILDIPGESDITYSSVATGDATGNLIQTQPIAGNPFAGRSNSGSLYFPHLGSVHEYFLNQIQVALRPYSFSEDAQPGPVPPPEPPPDEWPSISCPTTLPPAQSYEPGIVCEPINCLDVPDSAIPAKYLGNFKANVIDIGTRWVSGGASNVATCYNDTVRRSLDLGINPLYSLAIWIQESGASTYSTTSSFNIVCDPAFPSATIQDFGVNDISIAGNYDAQIKRFLRLPYIYPEYFSQCFPNNECNLARFSQIYQQGVPLTGPCEPNAAAIAYAEKTQRTMDLLAPQCPTLKYPTDMSCP